VKEENWSIPKHSADMCRRSRQTVKESESVGDWREVLKTEFCEGADESFAIQLRIALRWDKHAFQGLVSAMKACCEQYARSETMESWLAEGFFFASTHIEEWTSHPSFPKEHPAEYYEQAYQRLRDLAFWFFTGRSMYVDGKGYEPL
jgi:hypothetical protein